MRLLVDTHAFLWFILDDPRLSANADSLISDPNNQVEVSPATYWEIAIKIRLNKYSLPEPYEIFMDREMAANGFHVLHIEPKHAAPITRMPFHHRDPFDRLIIAQALVERIAVVSNDVILDAYGITRLW